MSISGTVPVGETIGGRFVVRSAVPAGALTFVEALDQQFGRPARVWLMTGADHIDNSAQAARTLASVRHPCLSPLHVADLAQTSVGPAVLAAFRGHQGNTVRAVYGGAPATAETTVTVIEQVAAALTAVHRAGQSLGNLSSLELVLDADRAVYVMDPLVTAVGHYGPAGAGPIHQQRDLGALVALVVELLTGQPVPEESRLPLTLPRLSGDRPALAELDRVLAEAVRPDRPPPQPDDLADRVRDALVSVL